jgi:hypothetical protein
MQDFSIERNGIPNLDFTGDLIGQGSQTQGYPPTAKIYRTKEGHYIGQLNASLKLSTADGPFNTPNEVIEWFKRLSGYLTPDVQAAIENATQIDDGFKKAWNDYVQ